jgi:hypothetical protein
VIPNHTILCWQCRAISYDSVLAASVPLSAAAYVTVCFSVSRCTSRVHKTILSKSSRQRESAALREICLHVAMASARALAHSVACLARNARCVLRDKVLYIHYILELRIADMSPYPLVLADASRKKPAWPALHRHTPQATGQRRCPVTICQALEVMEQRKSGRSLLRPPPASNGSNGRPVGLPRSTQAPSMAAHAHQTTLGTRHR